MFFNKIIFIFLCLKKYMSIRKIYNIIGTDKEN